MSRNRETGPHDDGHGVTMDYELRIQDPTDPARSLLVDVIVKLVGEGVVVYGRWFFGFLTGSGLDALLAVPGVATVMRTTALDILVGLDAVTDRAGLQRLLEIAAINPTFNPLIIKNTTGLLIHPKMLLMRYEDGSGAIIVGSNNMSGNGLSGNVEGYSILRYSPHDHVDLSDWDAFLARWKPSIFPIDDDALERAKQNEKRMVRVRMAINKGVVADGQLLEVTPGTGQEALHEHMLGVQLPKSDRWSQVQISKPIARDFFGFEPGVGAAPVLTLREYGTPEPERARPMLYLPKSDTIRFEVAAAKRAGAYPAVGRPVALLRRESAEEQRYRYVFLMPGDPGHAQVEALISGAFAGRGLPRVVLARNQVTAAWPECPL
ncbi:MAG: phospholipase D family protein [Acidobacteriota bacterium]|nr:phospholipase D family protein [Acidobacteriota bacterium]